MKERRRVICRECGKNQTVKSARKAGARCTNKECREPLCLQCGCTQLRACFVSQSQLLSPAPDYCYFIVPGVCSNPECIKKAYEAITAEEVAAAQLHYDELQHRNTSLFAGTTSPDATDETGLSEAELARIIITELLTEDQGRILSFHGIDVFDLIAASYPKEQNSIVSEIFSEWNELTQSRFFAAGEDLLKRALSATGQNR